MNTFASFKVCESEELLDALRNRSFSVTCDKLFSPDEGNQWWDKNDKLAEAHGLSKWVVDGVNVDKSFLFAIPNSDSKFIVCAHHQPPSSAPEIIFSLPIDSFSEVSGDICNSINYTFVEKTKNTPGYFTCNILEFGIINEDEVKAALHPKRDIENFTVFNLNSERTDALRIILLAVPTIEGGNIVLRIMFNVCSMNAVQEIGRFFAFGVTRFFRIYMTVKSATGAMTDAIMNCNIIVANKFGALKKVFKNNSWKSNNNHISIMKKLKTFYDNRASHEKHVAAIEQAKKISRLNTLGNQSSSVIVSHHCLALLI